jgi:hypothetical protein
VWPALIVVDVPRFDLRPRILDGRELVHVQALVAQEGFHVRAVC